MEPCDDADADLAPCAFCLVRQLQEWIDAAGDAFGAGQDWEFPLAGLTMTDETLQVFIGDTPVWNSQVDDPADLTLAACQQAFRTAVLPLAHVASYGLAPPPAP
jgi:hypothetical protein